MLKRNDANILKERLTQFPVVALIGPRQVGKTTLAKTLLAQRPCLYLDLENYNDVAMLSDPIQFLSMNIDKLIILDEIQRKPDLFVSLRGIVDEAKQNGRKVGQFLILGSASGELLRQSSESLAGRIAYIEMAPLTIDEVRKGNNNTLWLRGGYPDSFLAGSDEHSLLWRQMFIKTYLERDIPFFNPRFPTETLHRLWTMIAHQQGGLYNASQFAANLSISSPTIERYVGLLTDLFLIRRLAPWFLNTNKRLVKSSKLYIRDSGILHALLNIINLNALFGHPVLGASFEGYVIDNLLAHLPIGAEAYFYRTIRGAELDLYIRNLHGQSYAIEIKRSLNQTLSRGFYSACEDLKPEHKYPIYEGEKTFPLQHGVTAIGLVEFIRMILMNHAII